MVFSNSLLYSQQPFNAFKLDLITAYTFKKGPLDRRGISVIAGTAINNHSVVIYARYIDTHYHEVVEVLVLINTLSSIRGFLLT